MPRRLTHTKDSTLQYFTNCSYENKVISWLLQDGWQVFTPELDHGHKTDVLISDGPNFYRIQIKTVETERENHKVPNRWKNSDVDFVIFFVRNASWGYVAPAFEQSSRRLNHPEHQRFTQHKKPFLRAFHRL